MSIVESVTLLASVSTAVGVLLAWFQIRLAAKQAITQFEDGLTNVYRDLVRELPVKAMLGGTLTDDEFATSLSPFYRYFDLSNEQIFLRQQGRVSQATWVNWRDGIESNLQLPAFQAAWAFIKSQPGKRFSELRYLESVGFDLDPHGEQLELLANGQGH